MPLIQFMNPEHFNPLGKIQEGIRTGLSFAEWGRKNKEWERKEAMRKEIANLYDNESKAAVTPSAQEKDQYQQMMGVSPALARVQATLPTGPGEATDDQVREFAANLEKNYGAESGWTQPKPKKSLATMAQTQPEVKSYPFEQRAERLSRLKDIYLKYGEIDKAHKADKTFLETVKTVAAFSPKAAASIWNKHNPDMAISTGDVKRLNKGNPVVFGPNRDGIVQVNDDGEIEVVQQPTSKTQKPKTQLVYGTDSKTGQRVLYELGSGEGLPEGVLSDKEIDRQEKETERNRREKKEEIKETNIERRHRENLAERIKARENREGKENKVILVSPDGIQEAVDKNSQRYNELIAANWKPYKAETKKRNIADILGGPSQQQPGGKGTAQAATPPAKAPAPKPATAAQHPLMGRPAGRYRVNGKVVNWDGTKEI